MMRDARRYSDVVQHTTFTLLGMHIAGMFGWGLLIIIDQSNPVVVYFLVHCYVVAKDTWYVICDTDPTCI